MSAMPLPPLLALEVTFNLNLFKWSSPSKDLKGALAWHTSSILPCVGALLYHPALEYTKPPPYVSVRLVLEKYPMPEVDTEVVVMTKTATPMVPPCYSQTIYIRSISCRIPCRPCDRACASGPHHPSIYLSLWFWAYLFCHPSPRARCDFVYTRMAFFEQVTRQALDPSRRCDIARGTQGEGRPRRCQDAPFGRVTSPFVVLGDFLSFSEGQTLVRAFCRMI